MRLKAQPVRTDFNLTDTGIVSISGSWQRAETLRDTPLQFTFQWDRAQLGQVTKLAYGNDKGWRGGLKVSATLAGTPANLSIVTAASLQDFRRYDILGGVALRLAAQCSGRYSSPDHMLSEVACSAPVGDGTITAAGSINAPFTFHDYDLALTVRDLPLQSLVALARHSKQGMPDDLIATGEMNANFSLRRAADIRTTGTAWDGSGETSGFNLRSKLDNTDLALGRIPFAFSSPSLQKTRARLREIVASPETRFVVGPFNLALGRPVPAIAHGWASQSGYSFTIQGDAQVQRVLQLARIAGISAPQPAADGVARVDLQIAGAWSGFVAPKAVGKVQLHSIRAEVRGLNAPLEIISANLLLTREQVNVQNLTASIADTSWRGSLALLRQCTAPESCPIRFDLHAGEITTDRLNELINPHVRKQPWYRFLSATATGVPYLLTVHATGKLTANRVAVRNLVGDQVAANVELDQGKLRLSDLRAGVLGGTHIGEWEADFTAKPPTYSGTGTLDGVALDQLSASMKDDWITGSATATYRVKTSGLDATELFASATSTLKVDARDGWLRHVALAEGGEPLQVHRMAARLSLHDGEFEIQEGKLETSTGGYHVSGTATLTRILNLKLKQDGAAGFSITGTLMEPHVSPIVSPETQAALKP